MAANLHRAAERGDLPTLQALLDAGADLDAKDAAGWTPLLRAAKGGHLKALQLLLDRGAGLHACSPRSGGNILHLVAHEGHAELVPFLVARGADVNHADDRGMTPVQRAVLKNRPEVLRRLLEAGADPNLGLERMKPLSTAVTFRRRELVRLLLAHGADPNASDESGFGLLHQAVGTGDLQTTELLLQHGADPNAGGEHTTPLMTAISLNKLEAVRLLLAHGAVAQPEGQPVSALTLAGISGRPEIRRALQESTGTDLHQAAAEGRVAELTRLLEQGDLDRCDERGRTALMCACSAGHAEAAELLLDRGADLEAVDEHGFTALLHAVSGGQVRTTELLLKRGARCDVQNQWGQSPLERAVYGAVPQLVVLLRAAGAEPDLPTYGGLEEWDEVERRLEAGEPVDTASSSGMTLLMAAAVHGNVEAIRRLAARGASLDRLDHRGLSALSQSLQHLPAVRLLLELGADPNAAGEAGMAPLRRALLHEEPELVRLLAEKGADLEFRDPFGKTALASVADLPFPKKKNGELARVLCEAGARVDVRDDLGRTPLHAAAEAGLTEVVHTLLQYGAEVNARNEHGFTPLDSALTGHHPEVVQLLKARGGEAQIPLAGALLMRGIQGYLSVSGWLANFRARWHDGKNRRH